MLITKVNTMHGSKMNIFAEGAKNGPYPISTNMKYLLLIIAFCFLFSFVLRVPGQRLGCAAVGFLRMCPIQPHFFRVSFISIHPCPDLFKRSYVRSVQAIVYWRCALEVSFFDRFCLLSVVVVDKASLGEGYSSLFKRKTTAFLKGR